MFTRTIFVIGILIVAGALALGTLASDGETPESLDNANPPAASIDEGAVTIEPPEAARTAPSPEPPKPTDTPRPSRRPTETPPTQAPSPTETPLPTQRAQASFNGNWTVSYTITEGIGAGESYAFSVTLEQDGGSIRGGNDGVVVTGRVEGRTATLTYRQAALGYAATFTLTLVDNTWGGGAFTSAVNSGTSRMQRAR
jgi:hypothetical protein